MGNQRNSYLITIYYKISQALYKYKYYKFAWTLQSLQSIDKYYNTLFILYNSTLVTFLQRISPCASELSPSLYERIRLKRSKFHLIRYGK